MSKIISLFKNIFIEPTTDGKLQFIRYLFVGGLVTILDWALLFIFTEIFKIHYLVSAILSFIVSILANFILSKMLVFKINKSKVNKAFEFLGYIIIGVIGLGLTELIMYYFSEIINFHYMLSKAIATIIVLFWNYFARKYLLYEKSDIN